MTCLTDTELLAGPTAPAFDEHLDGCEACRRRAATLVRSAPSRATAVPLLLHGGDVVGRYVVLDIIGAGATSVVYSAYDPQLDRKVALKLRRPGDPGSALPDGVSEAMAREAQAIARLKHGNVVVVYDAGQHEGQLFLALEFIEGGHLGAWLGAPHEWLEILECCTQAGRGLAAAHAEGLVHRDFKPANVLVDQRSVARVTDFGLSTFLGAQTNARKLIGTPAYMAPEQLDGHGASAASDQFSFCVTVWESLSAARPFAGESIEALREAMKTPPVPPSQSEVPRWVWRALLKGLSVDRSARFSSMNALLTALDVERVRVASRRQWAKVLTAVSIAAALAIGLGVRRRALVCDQDEAVRDLWSRSGASKVHDAFAASGVAYAETSFAALDRRLRVWVQRYGESRRRVCEASLVHKTQTAAELERRMGCLERRRQVLVAFEQLIAQATPSDVERSIEATNRIGAPSDCETVDGPVAPVESAQIHHVFAQLAQVRALKNAGRYLEAQRLGVRVIADAAAAGAIELQAEGELLLGDSYSRLNNEVAAEEALYASIAHAEQAHHERLVTEAWVALTRAQSRVVRLAEQAHRSAHVATALLARRPDLQLRIDLLSAIGTIYVNEDRFEEAENAYRESLELVGPLSDENEVAYSVALSNIALVQSTRGQFAESIATNEAVLALDRRVWGEEHPLTVTTLNNLAVSHLGLSHSERALELFTKVLALRTQALGPDNALVGTTSGSVCLTLAALERFDEAITYCQRAVAILEKVPHHTDLEIALSQLASTFLRQGNLAAAEQAYTRALAERETIVGHDHISLAYDLVGLSRIALERKQPDRAVAQLERALALRVAGTGDPFDVCEVEWLLGRALIESGANRMRGEQLLRRVRQAIGDGGDSSADLREEMTAWEATSGRPLESAERR